MSGIKVFTQGGLIGISVVRVQAGRAAVRNRMQFVMDPGLFFCCVFSFFFQRIMTSDLRAAWEEEASSGRDNCTAISSDIKQHVSNFHCTKTRDLKKEMKRVPLVGCVAIRPSAEFTKFSLIPLLLSIFIKIHIAR